MFMCISRWIVKKYQNKIKILSRITHPMDDHDHRQIHSNFNVLSQEASWKLILKKMKNGISFLNPELIANIFYIKNHLCI